MRIDWTEWAVLGALTAVLAFFAVDAFGQSLYPGHPKMTHHGSLHFYDHVCCDKRDCRPVKPGEVKRHDTLPGWVHIPTGTFMHDDMVRKIPDKASDEDKYQSHICFYLRDFEGKDKKKGMVRFTTYGEKRWCFYPARPLL